MIRVTYWQKGMTRKLQLKGHAGYRPGNDIVCAGTSAIFYALLGVLKNKCPELTKYRDRPGDAYVLCRKENPEVRAQYYMAVLGLMQIAKKYPEYVSVRVRKNF